jgi:hypothetical protein
MVAILVCVLSPSFPVRGYSSPRRGVSRSFPRQDTQLHLAFASGASWTRIDCGRTLPSRYPDPVLREQPLAFSWKYEVLRRLRPFGMTVPKGFSAACESAQVNQRAAFCLAGRSKSRSQRLATASGSAISVSPTVLNEPGTTGLCPTTCYRVFGAERRRLGSIRKSK